MLTDGLRLWLLRIIPTEQNSFAQVRRIQALTVTDYGRARTWIVPLLDAPDCHVAPGSPTYLRALFVA